MLLAITTAVVGVAALLVPLWAAGRGARERNTIQEEIALLKELPDGAASEAMSRFIDRVVLEYIRGQRDSLRKLKQLANGYVFVGLSTMLAGLATVLVNGAASTRDPEEVVGVGLLTIGSSFCVVGLTALLLRRERYKSSDRSADKQGRA